MDNSSTDPVYFRDKGLEFLQKGKEYFNTHEEIEYKEKGYQLYKKGLDYMMKYAKMEKDQSMVTKVKGNFTDWIKEAKAMEATVIQTQQKKDSDSNDYSKPSKQDYLGPSQNNTTTNNKRPDASPNRENEDKSKIKKKLTTKEDEDASKLMSNLEAAIVTEKPNVKWDDIAGLEQAKKIFTRSSYLSN
jgi:vacuolar protein-sorting-associated protein 4